LDDYDAEFRFDRAPVGTLQGLRPEHVLYAGSVSKTLAPALRLGWLVVPQRLRAAVRDEKALADLGSPTLDLLALARLIRDGGYDRHLRRCRATYARRRTALLRELASRLPSLAPEGAPAGLHLAARLPPDVGEQAAVAACARRGLAVGGIGAHLLAAARPPTLLLGYAALPEAAAPAVAALLAAAVEEAGIAL
jgi:GntR family transcriptional regulator/MocR family aminotransferase